MAKPVIRLPHNYVPRAYQFNKWDYIQKGGRRAVSVWHRRAGKDVTEWNMMIFEAHKRKGQYFYFYPEFKQGRKAIWEGHTNDGMRFLDYIPEPLIESKNAQEMFVRLKCGSSIQIIGTDNIDAIMSSNPVGCVFSEYSLQDPKAWDFVRPILKVNGGWAVFNFTPRGLNHAFELYNMANDNPDWFCERLAACEHPIYNPGPKVPVTNVLTLADIDEEFASGMTENLIRSEYFCDFTASLSNILIPIDLVESALDRFMAYKNAEPVAGLDVGYSLNGDPSAIVIRQGGKIVCMEEVQLNDYDQIAGWAYKHMNKHNCGTVYIDGIGWGGGVATAMRHLYPGINVNSINVSENSSSKEEFVRLRDEIWWGARKWFESKQCCIPTDIPLYKKLIVELTTVEYEHTPSNKIKVQSKQDMKRSPNLADAFNLAVYGRPMSETYNSFLVENANFMVW